jgi:hypothetical protein
MKDETESLFQSKDIGYLQLLYTLKSHIISTACQDGSPVLSRPVLKALPPEYSNHLQNLCNLGVIIQLSPCFLSPPPRPHRILTPNHITR